LLMTSSVALQEGVMCCCLPLVGLVTEVGLNQVLTDTPWEAIATFGVMLLIVTVASASLSAGSQLCPAAASSTIFTSVGMSACYAVQMILHGQTPKPLTILGAALMLVSVSLMACARWFYTVADVDACDTVSDVATGSDASISSTGGDDTESESLASFVASEFSGVSLRQRGSAKTRVADAISVIPHAQSIGAAWA